jgi:hypothetical protein
MAIKVSLVSLRTLELVKPASTNHSSLKITFLFVVFAEVLKALAQLLVNSVLLIFSF